VINLITQNKEKLQKVEEIEVLWNFALQKEVEFLTELLTQHL